MLASTSVTAVRATNALLRDSLDSIDLGLNRRRRTILMDCGEALWTQRETLLPDLVHPSLQGYEAWARCLRPGLAQLAAF